MKTQEKSDSLNPPEISDIYYDIEVFRCELHPSVFNKFEIFIYISPLLYRHILRLPYSFLGENRYAFTDERTFFGYDFSIDDKLFGFSFKPVLERKKK